MFGEKQEEEPDLLNLSKMNKRVPYDPFNETAKDKDNVSEAGHYHKEVKRKNLVDFFLDARAAD